MHSNTPTGNARGEVRRTMATAGDEPTQMRLNHVPADSSGTTGPPGLYGGGQKDLASSPAEKQAAAKAIEQHIEPDTMPQSGTGPNSAIRATGLILALFLGVASCSDSKEPEAKPSPTSGTLTAGNVCAGTLGSEGAEALKRLAGTDEFTELPGTNDKGASNTFSLESAAETVHEDMTDRNQCTIFKSGDKTGHPVVSIDFSAAKFHPDQSTNKNRGSSAYAMGVYARAQDRQSATLIFKCSTHAPEKQGETTPYIEGSLSTLSDQIAGKATNDDLMTVLAPVSRKMAEELGCAEQASLPSRIPEAK